MNVEEEGGEFTQPPSATVEETGITPHESPEFKTKAATNQEGEPEDRRPSEAPGTTTTWKTTFSLKEALALMNRDSVSGVTRTVQGPTEPCMSPRGRKPPAAERLLRSAVAEGIPRRQ